MSGSFEEFRGVSALDCFWNNFKFPGLEGLGFIMGV